MMMTMATTMTMTTMMMRVMMTTIIITVTIIAIIMISSTIIDCLHIVCVTDEYHPPTLRRAGWVGGETSLFPSFTPQQAAQKGGGVHGGRRKWTLYIFPRLRLFPPPFPSPLPPTPRPPHPCVSKTGSIWKLLIMSLIGGIHTEI